MLLILLFGLLTIFIVGFVAGDTFGDDLWDWIDRRCHPESEGEPLQVIRDRLLSDEVIQLAEKRARAGTRHPGDSPVLDVVKTTLEMAAAAFPEQEERG